MKRSNKFKQAKVGFKGFVASLDVTSLESFGELVIGCRTFFFLEYNVLSLSFKDLIHM
jgi:hypothetical protein